ncbi:response regulator [uncultured Alsobacter sp.]|uniref:response regulator n=1 Tax=uncultured Alsobacter sp. TaxID=1748258 RepID=UPI0025DBEBD5|nr:response regulator [uncultured Alsobacter sp.]
MATILIADDEEPLRGFVARGLQLDGHVVEAAQDGAEALDMLTAPGAAYDLLLTDIRMPIMDGIALALAAARERPTMPILLMTGYADQRERARDLDALIRDVLTKPFSLADLRTMVRRTLEEPVS